MDNKFEAICVELDNLARRVENVSGDSRTLVELSGWMAPAMTMKEISEVASTLSDRIKRIAPQQCPDNIENFVTSLPARIRNVADAIVPQLSNSNVGQALPAYIATLDFIRSRLLPEIGWIELPKNSALPESLMGRVNSVESTVALAEDQVSDLNNKIQEINSAHLVASKLGEDLKSLTEAREKTSKTVVDLGLKLEKAKEGEKELNSLLGRIKAQYEVAEKLVAQCEQAYHITTTKGLAGAFDQRAKSLAMSIRLWVLGLLAALGSGYYFGSQRINNLNAAFAESSPHWGIVAINVALSILSIGAPLWFSWLATKQIGQRFRLSEDYAFKASIAKAYEGYRKEAAKIDPEFQIKLFGSALTRLDEAPLRLMETQQHSSPWHEFANSEAIKQALKLAPDLQSKLIDTVRDAIQGTRKAAGEATKVVADASKSSPSASPEK